jgi:hypothetical protein
VRYTGVTAEWAVAVARGVHRRGVDLPPPTIDEVWVGCDLALYVRYRVGARPVAARFRLDVDPTFGDPPSDADLLASDIFHRLRADPGPDAFVDEEGYRWWSDDPPNAGWRATLPALRILTIS